MPVMKEPGKGFGDEVGAVGIGRSLASDDPVSAMRAVNDYIQVVLHELQHIDEFILTGALKRPDAYSDERWRQMKNVYSLADGMTIEQRHNVLTLLQNAIEPEDRQTLRLENGKQYGAKSSEEFVAELNAMVGRFAMNPTHKVTKSVADVLYFADPELSEYMRGTIRNMADVLEASSQVFENRQFLNGIDIIPMKSSLGERRMAEIYKTSINALRTIATLDGADEAKAMNTAILRGLTAAPYSPSTFNKTIPTMTINRPFGGKSMTIPPTAAKAVEEVHKSLFADTTEKGSKAGILTRMIYPFTNLMVKMEKSGIPLANDVLTLANNVAPAAARIHTNLLRPFLTRGPDGRLVLDGENPTIRANKADPQGIWRKKLNNVLRWQNSSESMMFEKVDGVMRPTEKAKAVWERLSTGLTNEQKQVVMSSVDALMESMSIARESIKGTVLGTVRDRVAFYLMASNKGMHYDQALDMSTKVLGAFNDGSEGSVGLPPTQIGTLRDLLYGTPDADGNGDGLLNQLARLSKHLDERPWFASEQLVGDWIIRYRNTSNEIKYAAGKSKGHAEKIARELMADGNKLEGQIINKGDLKQYSEFDNPADVLSKFSETEQKKWDSFLGTLEKSYGPAIVEDLRSGYVPGAQAGKEMAQQGMKQFLQENKKKVDLDRHDYLEASLQNYLPKLSSALANRSSRDRLALIMRDPRAKGFDTWQKDVRDHFDNMFTPTPQVVKEVKAGVSAYFLGLNLSSALVELSQSPISLVPWLINEGTGGPMKAYKTMLSAGQKMFDFSQHKEWVKDAARLESEARSGKVLSKNWTEDESIAWVYQQALRDGAITHGAISEINDSVGLDQGLLMAKTFGSGDHVDTSVPALMRNKIYLAGHAMMSLYSWASLMNTKVAFIAGTKLGYEKGLRGTELYDYAKKFRNLTTMGGGKANLPGYVSKMSNDYTRAPIGIANTLQSYGLGMVAQYTEMGLDSINRTKGMTPAQKAQARKAFGLW